MDTLPIGITKLPSTKRRNHSFKSCKAKIYQIHMIKKIINNRRKMIYQGVPKQNISKQQSTTGNRRGTMNQKTRLTKF